MTALLLYIARSGLYLGVFYAFYLLVMRRTTFFRLNRFVLLAGSVACALLPLLRVRTAPETAITGLASLTAVTEAVQATGLEAGIAWGAVLWPLYLAGALSVLGYILLSTARIHSLARKGRRTSLLHLRQNHLHQPRGPAGASGHLSPRNPACDPPPRPGPGSLPCLPDALVVESLRMGHTEGTEPPA